jgi:hypothetical protein
MRQKLARSTTESARTFATLVVRLVFGLAAGTIGQMARAVVLLHVTGIARA